MHPSTATFYIRFLELRLSVLPALLKTANTQRHSAVDIQDKLLQSFVIDPACVCWDFPFLYEGPAMKLGSDVKQEKAAQHSNFDA